MKAKDVLAMAARLGVRVRTNSPGDGKTRYWFNPPFAGDREFAAVGARDAIAWLSGYEEGRGQFARTLGGYVEVRLANGVPLEPIVRDVKRFCDNWQGK